VGLIRITEAKQISGELKTNPPNQDGDYGGGCDGVRGLWLPAPCGHFPLLSVLWSGFRVSGFGFRISGFGFRVSSFRFRVSGFEFQVLGFGLNGVGVVPQ